MGKEKNATKNPLIFHDIFSDSIAWKRIKPVLLYAAADSHF